MSWPLATCANPFTAPAARTSGFSAPRRLLVAALLIGGCGKSGDGTDTTNNGTDSDTTTIDTTGWALWLTPGASDDPEQRDAGIVVLGLNGAIDLAARVFDENDQLVINDPSAPVVVLWSSSDPNVVSVDEFGRATGVSTGQAVITAQVRDTDLTRSVTIDVQFSDIATLTLNPERVAMNQGASRGFAVAAVDTEGFPTTVDCTGGAVGEYDAAVLGATYDGALGAESVTVQGLDKGFTLFALSCDGFSSSPVIVEVKSPVVIPPPSTSATTDFGLFPDLAIQGTSIAVSSYDRQNGFLLVTSFRGAWESEVLNGQGNFGLRSAVAHETDGTLLVCALERPSSELQLACWQEESGGFWSKQVIATTGVTDSPLDLEIAPDGTAYLLHGARLWTSTTDRATWTSEGLSPSGVGGVTGGALAIGSDGHPRVAFQGTAGAAYGAPVGGEVGAYTWLYEPIESTDLRGANIRLAVGANHRPQVVYLKQNKVVYGVKAGGNWYTEIVDAVTVSGSLGFTLNGWGEPRVSYYDSNAQTLRYGYRSRRNIWRVSQPIDGTNLGDASALFVDENQRSQLVYHNEGRGNVGYYVEPMWLDYTDPAATSLDSPENTGVDEFLMVDADGDGATLYEDCDDHDATRFPDNPETICNDVDDDCKEASLDRPDADNDGFVNCPGEDCDDTTSSRQPDLVERCDNVEDNDCDPSTPSLEALDADGDTFTTCRDCDDTDGAVASGGGCVARDLSVKLIPAGTFTMGCVPTRDGNNCQSNELPAHNVTLTHAFYMMEAEVTEYQYQLGTWSPTDLIHPAPVPSANGNRALGDTIQSTSRSLTQQLNAAEGRPNCSNTQTASVYSCTGWRLPTEAEWEYAARAGESHRYPGSNNVEDVAVCASATQPNARVVGCTKGRNAFGLCDMSGNVSEWVHDLYGPYTSAAVTDPINASTFSYGVTRGGAVYDNSSQACMDTDLRSAGRSPDGGLQNKGFRLVRTAP